MIICAYIGGVSNNGGDWDQRLKDGAHWFQTPGAINGTQGVYQIGINNSGSIFHRTFIPY